MQDQFIALQLAALYTQSNRLPYVLHYSGELTAFRQKLLVRLGNMSLLPNLFPTAQALCETFGHKESN